MSKKQQKSAPNLIGDSSTPKKKKPKVNPALKYSGMALQMTILIVIGVWIGQYLDGVVETTKPYFTILLAIVFLGGALYSIIREVSKDG